MALLLLAACAHRGAEPGQPSEVPEPSESAACADHLEHMPDALVLAEKGHSKYRIVIADDAPLPTVYAAEELREHIREITGVELPVVSDRLSPRKREIIVGHSSRLKKIKPGIDLHQLGEEGYILRTAGPRLIIAGGEPRGTLYGVYGLLEDHFGCRWFTPRVTRIPRQDRLEIPPLDETRIPAFEYRETYLWEANDGDWAARNRLNRNGKWGGLSDRHGGRIEWVPGLFAHTFAKFVPPDTYFDSHPEYFSLVDGKRLKDQSQLCCTNEDVIRIVTDGVLQAFREHQEADILSISQNDWNNYCECPNCKALADSEGTCMAPVLFMVNRAAEALEREFPGKSVETLAYQWTRKAPKTMHPRPNVVIRLCTIECCFSHPLRTCTSPRNQAFARDLREWSKVADRLWIWNYNTSFAHYFIPFPDMRTRGDNIRFFMENHVKGIFQQDVYSTGHGELSGLSGYLNAKLLWAPESDENAVIDEFLGGVYGPSAKYIREYIDLLHDRVERENIHIGIWQGPDAEYLTDSIIAVADSLWNEAEASSKNLPVVLERVRIARLSEDYAVISRDMLRGDALLVNQDSCRLEVNPAFTGRLERFCRVASRAGVRRLKEYDLTPDEFRKNIETSVCARTLTPITSSNRENVVPGIAFRYFEGSWKKRPCFKSLTPDAIGKVDRFTLPFAGNDSTYGFTFSGYIAVPQDGIYTFWTRSDGYSALSVSGTDVIKNGGSDPIRERCGYIALKAGLHPLELTYFTKEGCSGLAVSWRGPGFEKEEIPGYSFRYGPILLCGADKRSDCTPPSEIRRTQNP